MQRWRIMLGSFRKSAEQLSLGNRGFPQASLQHGTENFRCVQSPKPCAAALEYMLAASAACDHQVPGQAYLARVAAQHNIVACRHRQPAAVSPAHLPLHLQQIRPRVAAQGPLQETALGAALGQPPVMLPPPRITGRTSLNLQQQHQISVNRCCCCCMQLSNPSRHGLSLQTMSLQQQRPFTVAHALATAGNGIGRVAHGVERAQVSLQSTPSAMPLCTGAVQLMPAVPAVSASGSGPQAIWGAAGSSSGSSSGSSADLGLMWRTKRAADMTPPEKHQLLREKLAGEWGQDPPELRPGSQRLVCPECGNGSHGEDCFSVTVQEDSILWCCHRASCGYKGTVSAIGGWEASSSAAAAAVHAVTQVANGAGRNQVAALVTQAAPAGVLYQQQQQFDPAKPAVVLGSKLQQLTPDFLQWFENRGISKATLERNGVMCEKRYCAALGGEEWHIAFPYRKNGVIVNIKYRALEKHFSQSKGGEQIFYGYDDAKGVSTIIIVEGEMDKLAIEEALWQQYQQQQDSLANAAGEETTMQLQDESPFSDVAVLSVPAGAPAPGPSGPQGSLERKFRYVHSCSDLLSSAERIILAVDADGPGIVLADELSRRIGREKCWRVTWPTSPQDSLAPGAGEAAAAAAAAAMAPAGSSSATAAGDAPAGVESSAVTAPADSKEQAAAAAAVVDAGLVASRWARKDANEVLMKDGADVLCAYLHAAQPLPIRGLFKFDDFFDQVYDLYNQGLGGLSWGVSTGWESVDSCYKVVPGELTIVTGLPNSGKSEWLDALVVNLARQHGWRLAVCSMENSTREHGRKLMEKYTGKAFFNAAYSEGTARMSVMELVDALIWIDEHFHIIRPPPDQLPTVEYILDKARAAVLRYGIQGLVVDPYNELDHHRPSEFSETEHVSRLLTKIKRFAQHYDCHVWFVAHPRTQRGLGAGGGTAMLTAPSMYDISGSANFINKADNGIVVHRPFTAGQEGKDPYAVQLLVRKVRNKLAGKIGDVVLRYDRATGCYWDYDQ